LLLFSIFSASASAYECTDKCKVQENSCLCPSAPMWVSQDNPLTVISNNKQHIVKVIDVTESGDSCGISVDDVVKWVPLDKTIEVNGINVVLFDAKTVHSQLQDIDTCRLFISGTVVLPVEKIVGIKNETENAAPVLNESVNVFPNVTVNEAKENSTAPVQEQPETIWQIIIGWLVNLFRK